MNLCVVWRPFGNGEDKIQFGVHGQSHFFFLDPIQIVEHQFTEFSATKSQQLLLAFFQLFQFLGRWVRLNLLGNRFELVERWLEPWPKVIIDLILVPRNQPPVSLGILERFGVGDRW